jgi:hypothetical protein
LRDETLQPSSVHALQPEPGKENRKTHVKSSHGKDEGGKTSGIKSFALAPFGDKRFST